MSSAAGKLYIIPCDLSGENPENVLPKTVASSIRSLDIVVAEEEKTVRAFIKRITPEINQQELKIILLNEHSNDSDLECCVDYLKEGKTLGLISEAGCPVVADPGAPLIARAHRIGAKVIPLVGPSSILLALMGSGFTGQRFRFVGYLPKDSEHRVKVLRELEDRVMRHDETQIFIETPYRNSQLLKSILLNCSKNLNLCAAISLTTEHERIISKPVSSWISEQICLDKEPCVFCLGR